MKNNKMNVCIFTSRILFGEVLQLMKNSVAGRFR